MPTYSYSTIAQARNGHQLVIDPMAETQAAPSTRGRPGEWIVFVVLLMGAVWMFSAWSLAEGSTSTDGMDEVNVPALIR